MEMVTIKGYFSTCGIGRLRLFEPEKMLILWISFGEICDHCDHISTQEKFWWCGIMKQYTNNEIIVRWDPEKCIHSAECVKCLPGVFDVHNSPWINMEGASSEEIMKAIDRCPSGALSYKRIDEFQGPRDEGPTTPAEIRVVKDGPLLVKGRCTLINEDGEAFSEEKPFALCRCGRSKNKPLCDGSHRS